MWHEWQFIYIKADDIPSILFIIIDMRILQTRTKI